MGNLLEHAKEELRIAGLIGTDDSMQTAMNDHILHMVEEFEKEGHSGFSASYAIGQLKKLLNYEPLTPLTGEEDEWTKVTDDMYQNKRCSTIFKDTKNGQAYNIEGNVFRNQNGNTFTNEYSRTPVEFPYYPQQPNIVEIYESK